MWIRIRYCENGKEVALSSKEFALLRYMVQNEGIVLSREKLEQHLWNYDYMGSSNVVDVYIRYLRKKIDEGFEPKLIHTIRGAGYVLRVSGCKKLSLKVKLTLLYTACMDFYNWSYLCDFVFNQ